MQSFELSGKHTHEINPFVAVGRRSQLDLFAPCTPLESQTIHLARTQDRGEGGGGRLFKCNIMTEDIKLKVPIHWYPVE